MLLRVVEVVVFLFFSLSLYAGDPVYSRFGAGETAKAYACVASKGHWCSFHNQAALAYSNAFSVGTSLESRFMMAEMSSKVLTCIIPGRPAPLGLMVMHYGNDQYAIITGGLGSALILTEGLSLGVQVDVINEHCAGAYRDLTHVTFEVGMLGQPLPDLTFGFHLFNPMAQANGLPSSIRTGLSWSSDESLALSLEAVKTTGESLSLHTGISWRLQQCLVLRAGYRSMPSSFAFGAGYDSEGFSIDAGFMINNKTGITPSVSLLWKHKKR